MNHSLTLGYTPKWLYTLFAISLLANIATAQRKTGSSTTTVTKPPAITLVDSLTTFQLDTIRKNSINQFSVPVYLQLSKGTSKSSSILLTIDPFTLSRNIKLTADTVIKIDSLDWNDKKDVFISKKITLYVQQTALVKDTQYIALRIKGDTLNKKSIIKIMPYAPKSKNPYANLVAPGNAEIESGRLAISHYSGSAVNSIDTIHIRVKLLGNYDLNHNQLYFALLDTSLSKHFKILENPVTVTQEEWDEASNSPNCILNIPLHINTINLVDSVNNIQYLDIVLMGQNQVNKGSQRINLSKKDKPFWAEIGTNFDLLDNIKTNNFYAGVYMFDKDIAKFHLFNFLKRKADRHNEENNLSFIGGVYESQSVSLGSTADMPYTYKNYNPITQKYAGYRDTGSISTTTSIKNIGLFFSPQVRLTNGKVEENGIHLFISIYTEMLWQRITSSFNYPTPTAALTALPDSTNLSKFSSKQSSLSLDYRSQYYGIGIPVYIKHKDFNLYLNWVPLGFTTQQFVFVQDNYAPDYNTKFPYRPIPATQNNSNYDIYLLNYARPKNVWNAFFIIQYRLNEVAYGITFSGEIRSLYLQGSKPVITLALSKKFDLSAVLKPVVGAF